MLQEQAERQWQRLIELAKKQHFTVRTMASILEAAGLQSMHSYFRENYVDLKGQDARELLTYLRDLPPEQLPKAAVHTERSSYFLRLHRQDRKVQRPGGQIPFERVAQHFALHSPDFEHFNFHALNVALVQVLGEMLEVTLEPEEIAAEVKRFRLFNGLKEAELPQWIEDNDLDQEEFAELIQQRALCRRLQRWLMRGGFRSTISTKSLLNELRWQNRYVEWADETARTDTLVAENFPDFPQAEHWPGSVEQLLLDHLRSTACKMPAPHEDWAQDAGFRESEPMMLELTRARLARQAIQELAASCFPS